MTRSTLVKTRKPHTCDSCLRKFPAGTNMYDSACVFQGEFSNYYLCMTCKEILDKGDYQEGWMYGELSGGDPEKILNDLITRQYDIF